MAQAKQIAKAALRTAASFVKFFFGFMAGMIIPLLIIIFVLVIFLLVFIGGAENNTYLVGTYNCSDETIAETIEAYTKIAYDFNENVIKANSTSKWKTGLKNLNIDTSTKKNNPTTITYGSYDEYTAGDYDYDPERLIAFMCAYTYDFTNTDSDTDTDIATDTDIEESSTGIPIWEWKDSYKNVLQALFEVEYMFVCKYNDASTWQSMSSCTLYPNESDTFAAITSSGTYSESIATISYVHGSSAFSYVSQYARTGASEDKLYIALKNGTDSEGNTLWKGEILNYGCDTGIYSTGDFQKTGWTLQLLNTTYNIGATTIPAFYSVEGDRYYFYTAGSISSAQKYYRTNESYNIYGDWVSWVISSTDWSHYIGGTRNYKGVRYFQKDYYNKECKLYTCVVQKMTFDEAIQTVLGAMDNAEQRISYYLTIMGETTSDTDTDTDSDSPTLKAQTTYNRGNHQVITSPLDTDMTTLTEDDSIYNDYGYDVQAWNETHCGVATRQSTSGDSHIGIDIEASAGDKVYAMFDGEIIEYNEDIGAITLESNGKINYWYMNDGDGKEYGTRAAYCNVTINSDILQKLKNGETVTVAAGDLLGTVNSNHYCVSDMCGILSKSEYILNDSVSTDYLHISVEVEILWDWKYVYPSFLIY